VLASKEADRRSLRERGVQLPGVQVSGVSRDRPVLHPGHRETDESGPWLAILVTSALGWGILAAIDYQVLAEGTILWATVRSIYTLLLAPLAAAALLQDTRFLGTNGTEVGRLKWLYALVAVGFPPIGAVYLGHRRWLLGDRHPSDP
jgi:hypothetical protein